MYRLRVRVSDPAWPDVTSTAQVDVRQLQQDALQNAASLRLSSESRDDAALAPIPSFAVLCHHNLQLLLLPDLSVEQFFSSRGSQESPFGRLTRALAELLQTQPENVQIFSVGGAGRLGEESLNVWFAAHGSPYYKAEKLLGYVAANKAKVSVVS